MEQSCENGAKLRKWSKVAKMGPVAKMQESWELCWSPKNLGKNARICLTLKSYSTRKNTHIPKNGAVRKII